MKLQLALDDVSFNDALVLLKEISEYTDIIEVGTPFVIEYGMEAVRAVRKLLPHKELLCDAKIMDGGTIEANSAFNAGADYVTVMGVTDAATIKAVLEAAKAHKKSVVADLLCVEDFSKSIPALEFLGIDTVAVHVGVDQQRSGRTPLQDLINVKNVAKNVKVAVAGGINSSVLHEYTAQKPDVIIVGGGIIHAENPAVEAKRIYDYIRERSK